ncbi:origin of replication complex subunit 3 isoform X1 [Coffea eugenioides]|uniref:origin of replication complex subunit 3 isoform X1 n=1 Tax=Coffea eugenioides TaxID=49369 RepID=UPI000F60C2EA|nr:origin of replication complex subunit 3 isoform X1 [Coffea eugenioides]XP_027147942.1 origin of replication complex subunit 3 isoform X1 [Coffea eugenioides]
MATSNPVVVDENSLQPFFVLHKASQPPRKTSGKTKRRIDLSPLDPHKSNNGSVEDLDCFGMRLQTFHFFWSKIEVVTKDVLREINGDVFDKIGCWIRESFDAISSCKVSDLSQATNSYPLLLPASHLTLSKQLFTGLVCTKNMEFVDDIPTFTELAQHLKSCGCHVANLSSLDFYEKNGISNCLRNLLRQFLTGSTDAADISSLASWYHEQDRYENPIIVIIEGIERCCESVLSDFITLLSEWTVKLPIILIMGVTTIVDALRDILPSSTLQYLSPSKFVLESPTERMDAVIESVLVKYGTCFCLGHEVATFLRNYFLREDGTLTSFIRAFKMACAQHFILYPSGLAISGLLENKYSHDLSYGTIASLQGSIVKQAFGLPSQLRNNQVEPDGDIFHDLTEIQRHWHLWSSLVMCIYEAAKYQKTTLLDLYCEVLDPQLYKTEASGDQVASRYSGSLCSKSHCLLGKHPSLEMCGSICQAARGLRDLPAKELWQLLMKWSELTNGTSEVHEKIKELQSLARSEDRMHLSMQPMDMSNIHTTRGNLISGKDMAKLSEQAARLAGCMVWEYMEPIECIPLHEVICFKNVDKLQSALIGDPRTRIQIDLLESQKFLKCSCCRENACISLPSIHDTSIIYSLAQEHGDLINIHDWFQSFKVTISKSGMRTKSRLKQSQSPSPKKRKPSNEPQKISEASIQARFCRAVSELQITGLIRMPSKRRQDYVQRVAFGL